MDVQNDKSFKTIFIFFPPKTERDLYAFAIYDIMMTEFSFCVELSL